MITEKKSIKETVYNSVLKNIIKGEYPVNSIINERVLIDKYNVSKSPVREALLELCKDGILKSIPRYGYQVVQITPKEISNIQELRLVVELAALRKSINYLHEDAFILLEAHSQQAKEMEMDILKHWSHNMDFHLLLCSFCENDMMYQTLDKILKFCSRGAAQYYTKSWSNNKLTDATLHFNLIQALRAKNLEQAEQILTEDISSMKHEILNG